MSARGWWLFAALSVLWGIPYLFIKEAVDTISPAGIVAGRTLLGALILLPLALHRKALRPALKVWPWVLAFGAVEMAGPFFLLSHAEQTLPSGLTGLLVATVPLFAAVIGVLIGDRIALQPLRMLGLAVGFAGVAAVVLGPGMDHGAGGGGLVAVGEVLLVAVLYATAPFIIATKLRGVPSLGSITLSLAAVGVFYLPLAFLTQHEVPSARSVWSLVGLGVLCTAVAFVALFALIAEIGPVRAPLITYVNPVVAVALGVLLLAEPLGLGLLIGFPLILLGCWLAATGGRLRTRTADAPRDDTAARDAAAALDAPALDRADTGPRTGPIGLAAAEECR